MDEERTDDHVLPVTGAIPPDLDGTFLRNGPNPAVLPIHEEEYDWFGGDGMVHAVSLRNGEATGYRNRWVRTRALAASRGTVPPRGPSEPVNGPANTHVIRHGGTTLALAESGLPHALSPGLERARIHDFNGGLGSPMTAHPKLDPDTGELVFFGTDVFGPPYLRTHVVDTKGVLVRTEVIDVPRATMMHDFGMTASRLVFLDLPVVFDLGLATSGRTVPYHWLPDAGARVGVMPRNGSGADINWIGIDQTFVFHVLNCYDRGDAIVMDVVRYDQAFDTGAGEAIVSCLPALARWTIDPVGNRVSEQRLDDVPIEFPRVADATVGLPHRYGYCVRTGDQAEQPTFEGLIKYDLARDLSTRFDPGPYRFPGEPIFVKGAEGRAEDEGWVLSLVYDADRDASDLVILDSTSFAGPPVAIVHLPARIPFGFHGSWVPTGS